MRLGLGLGLRLGLGLGLGLGFGLGIFTLPLAAGDHKLDSCRTELRARVASEILRSAKNACVVSSNSSSNLDSHHRTSHGSWFDSSTSSASMRVIQHMRASGDTVKIPGQRPKLSTPHSSTELRGRTHTHTAPGQHTPTVPHTPD